MGLIFLTMMIGGVGWATTADTEAVIDSNPVPARAIVQAAAGADQSRQVEFNRRTAAENWP
jgi:hypothetical protein